LPWNDLIPMCVPLESGNSAENPEFRKMRTGINRNTGRNAQPRLPPQSPPPQPWLIVMFSSPPPPKNLLQAVGFILATPNLV
jgi:hypothetical protein